MILSEPREQKFTDGSAAYDASFTSFDADGWTLNYSAADGTARKWIALAFGTAAAGGRPLPQRVLSGPFAGPLGGPL